jgi:hypothetical protein
MADTADPMPQRYKNPIDPFPRPWQDAPYSAIVCGPAPRRSHPKRVQVPHTPPGYRRLRRRQVTRRAANPARAVAISPTAACGASARPRSAISHRDRHVRPKPDASGLGSRGHAVAQPSAAAPGA